jgi:acyl dehydratase
MSYIRKKAIEGLKVGDTFSISRQFSEPETISFAEITKDYNPVHFDARFTEVKNFKGCICHGLLVASMLSEIGGQMGWLASEMNFKFKKPVYLGDTVVCKFTIIEIDARGRSTAKAEYVNQDKTTVIEAQLKGILPGTKEKEVLEAMVAEGDPTNKIG